MRYRSVSFRISYPPLRWGANAPPFHSVDVLMDVLSGIGLDACCTLDGIVAPIGIWIIVNWDRIDRSKSCFPA